MIQVMREMVAAMTFETYSTMESKFTVKSSDPDLNGKVIKAFTTTPREGLYQHGMGETIYLAPGSDIEYVKLINAVNSLKKDDSKREEK